LLWNRNREPKRMQRYVTTILSVLLLCGLLFSAPGAIRAEIELSLVELPLDLHHSMPNYPSGNFPAPSPLLPHPPVYDENRTATLMLTGAQVQNSNNAGQNDFGVGGEITFSSGIKYATVFPNEAPGTFKVVNATELLSNISFAYFVYYKHPLAQYASLNFPASNPVASLYQPNQRSPNYTAGAVVIKQSNVMPSSHGSIYVSFNVYDPQNTSRVPNIPSSLLDMGVLSILDVPCSGAGIEC
jgi:hypothetical protein